MSITTKNISSPSKALNLVKLISLLVLALFFSCQTATKDIDNLNSVQADSPLSIAGLQQRTFQSNLSFEKELVGTDQYKADLWSYDSDSLKIYTLINTPTTTKPTNGFPVLIFGHGFHPEPKKYGVSTQTGKDWRPGDYYRGIPEAYAEKGYVAITPDYRGHNISDGFEYTKTSYLASTYYAIDVLHLIAALSDLKDIDLEKVYYLGHSMGGDVGLKMLLATNKIKAASLWAPVSATTWEQALYYGKYYDENGDKTDSEKMTEYMSKMDGVIQNLDFPFDIDKGDAIHYIQDLKTPVIIHHSRGESSVPYSWSESLAAKLFKHGKPFGFYAYESENHLFKRENRIKAVERDIAFFDKN